jgi:hypothetical protein
MILDMIKNIILKNTVVVVIVLFLLLVVSAGSAYYFYSQFNALKTNPNLVTQEEVKSLISKVGKLIVLPQGEDATIATVNEPEKLKDQLFFAKAKKGYKVLIYTNAKKAILYDPVNNLIVEVAPVNIGAQTTPTTPTTSVPNAKK